MQLSNLFGTSKDHGEITTVVCQYCPFELSGYEAHIKQLLERRPARTSLGVKWISAMERIGWTFPEGVEITDHSVTGICPVCTVADSES